MDNSIEHFQQMLAQAQKQYKDLLEKYRGVRPSWVSEELCHIEMRMANYKSAIEELENEQGYTAYGERPECDFSGPK